MLQQVYIGEVDLEEKETQDTLITMVEMLKKNKYIRWDLYAAISSNNPPVLPKRSASVDFWFSAFKESDQAEEDGTFFKQLGSFLKKQTRYLQVSIIKLNQSMIFCCRICDSM